MTVRLADLADARVAVWGFGREGRAALAALRRYFPDKALTLFCSIEEARALPAHDSAAGGEADPRLQVITDAADVDALRGFDIVIKSPGISPYKPPAAPALRAGVRFTSGSALWFAEHPHARTICVTGTKGKSTVSALIAHLLRKSGKCVALAGNIGLPLLDLLEPERALSASGGSSPAAMSSPRPQEREQTPSPSMYPSMKAGEEEWASRHARQHHPTPLPDWWVIELSSFQTHDFGGAPTVAVVNNLYEEHLDWHGTRERYAGDKLAIAAQAQALVVNAQPELLARTAAQPRRSVFGTAEGWHVRDGAIRRGSARVLALSQLLLPGEHNALNVCAALAAMDAAGIDALALAAHAATFQPLPHRLQRLGERHGIGYVNDSIATTPYATIEALRSLGGDVAVLVGGFDRGIDWTPFVRHVAEHPPHAIVTMGANGPAIAAALKALDTPGFALAESASLAAALAAARGLTPAGGVILLSPGAPSFDQFRDYAERGREFARLGGFDPASIAQIDGLGIA